LLHDEQRLLRRAHVLQHIAGDRDDVGELAALERARLGINAEQVRRSLLLVMSAAAGVMPTSLFGMAGSH